MADTIWGPGYNLEDRVRLSELRVFQFNIWPFDFWSLSLLRDVNIRTHQVWSFGASHAWDCLSVSGYLGLYVYGSAPPSTKKWSDKRQAKTKMLHSGPLYCTITLRLCKVKCQGQLCEMVRFTLSNDQNMQILGVCIPVVPHSTGYHVFNLFYEFIFKRLILL